MHDQHPRPRAADPKDDHGFMYPERTDPATAWRKPYVELNPPNNVSVIVMDCDDADAYMNFWFKYPRYPKPHYQIRNRKRERYQAGWILDTPVHTNEPTRRYPNPCPQRWLAQVATRMTYAMGADRSFNNGVARNPTYKSDTLEIQWTRSRVKGYTLADLGNPLPNVRYDQLVDSGIGRNVTLFNTLMQFAGRPENQYIESLLPTALTLNQQFDYPLPYPEVLHIVKSVERYRVHFDYDKSWAAQSRRGRKSGRKRREGTKQRDLMIRVLYESREHSIQAIAREFDLGVSTVRHVLNRDCKAYAWDKRRHTDTTRRDARILELHNAGSSNRAIGRELGIAHTTVNRIVKAGIESGTLSYEPTQIEGVTREIQDLAGVTPSHSKNPRHTNGLPIHEKRQLFEEYLIEDGKEETHYG